MKSSYFLYDSQESPFYIKKEIYLTVYDGHTQINIFHTMTPLKNNYLIIKTWSGYLGWEFSILSIKKKNYVKLYSLLILIKYRKIKILAVFKAVIFDIRWCRGKSIMFSCICSNSDT